MREYYEIYKAWRHEKRRAMAQWYADLIIRQIDNATSDREREHWIMQGIDLDMKMVYKYNIYLH